MKEALLHYLWKFRKLGNAATSQSLFTTSNESIEIINPGTHNQLSGPDFFNAQIRINNQHWAGNIEIHVRCSDWFLHNHEQDSAYNNVILHVVWEADCEVYDVSNQPIPTLELNNIIDKQILLNYQKLLETKNYKFINCEADFAEVSDLLVQNWLERIYFERLERKVLEVERLLMLQKGDWEAVLFAMLARNFGTVVNADAFEEIALIIPFKTIRKLAVANNQLEAVFLGICGLLNTPGERDAQTESWLNDFEFNKSKFDLKDSLHHAIQFFKLRPPNFPTIRLSQLAQLYEKHTTIFAQINAAKTRKEFQSLFTIETSTYWQTHYNFNKTHKKRIKKLTPAFVDLLIINSIIPVKFAFAKAQGIAIEENLLELITAIPSEKNSIVSGFHSLKPLKHNALNTQAFIELKKNYCNLNRCLSCQIGNSILNRG
ncbi:DUF2851 family protein [Leeuwenhoekiella sp. MAR_2009_132]|uniref:DUF2851 family protein n=1 Tax=Leeuwenhoekiella sp. MAR_2009_132 TaxID=1392489 RepID=UPI000490F613|nr:DUF2851 family protein [Leeuwenhoekiella sp. MAR_2009_132]